MAVDPGWYVAQSFLHSLVAQLATMNSHSIPALVASKGAAASSTPALNADTTAATNTIPISFRFRILCLARMKVWRNTTARAIYHRHWRRQVSASVPRNVQRSPARPNPAQRASLARLHVQRRSVRRNPEPSALARHARDTTGEVVPWGGTRPAHDCPHCRQSAAYLRRSPTRPR